MRMTKVIRALTRRKTHLQTRLDSWVGEKTGGYFHIAAEHSALEEALVLCEAESNRLMVEVFARNEVPA